MLAVASTGGCSWEETKRLALPEAASDRAPIIYDVWVGFWIGAAIVGVLVWGLIFWVSVHYRRRDDDEVPPQTRYNLPLEVLYTAAPFIVILVLFFHTVTSQNAVLARVGESDHTVRVVGAKWAWTFNYRDEGVFDFGTPAEPADLWLPVDEVVTFTLESPDVIHSFWVPAFYFKRDVFPGNNENIFQITPTEEGDFPGRCAELCGMYHSRMLFEVHIVSREEYDQHIEDLRAAGQVGDPTGASEASEIAGRGDAEGAEQ
jgi:cytochrome c oxidase subunit 2